jgi:hypothetical protein
MQLDDDYLLPGAGAAMLEAIRRAGPGEAVLLLGVQIVDRYGVRRREQQFRHEQYLEPRQALRRLLRNSCAGAHRRGAARRHGAGGPVRHHRRRRHRHRHVGAAVLPLRCPLPAPGDLRLHLHEAATTTGMWNPGTIRANAESFDRAVARGVVPERTIRRWQADWYHQFTLAGAYRRLRMGTSRRSGW